MVRPPEERFPYPSRAHCQASLAQMRFKAVYVTDGINPRFAEEPTNTGSVLVTA